MKKSQKIEMSLMATGGSDFDTLANEMKEREEKWKKSFYHDSYISGTNKNVCTEDKLKHQMYK